MCTRLCVSEGGCVKKKGKDKTREKEEDRAKRVKRIIGDDRMKGER